MCNRVWLGVLSLFMVGTVGAADFQHTLSGQKPWTNENFPDVTEEFHFAVLPDRTGAERKGFFDKAIDALNRLRPAFVMSVGDLIACGGHKDVRQQWAEFDTHMARLDVPFFSVVGNHDIWTGIKGMTPERQRSIDAWQERYGTNTYYSFTFKNCLFVCFNTMEKHDYFPPREALSTNQIAWALSEFEKHKDVRWRFLFMHKPLDWTSDRWLAFERKINKYDYTVFCGDWHNHCTAIRHGKKYYMIGTAGGGFDLGVTCDDLRYGIMDSITWVTVTKKGPIVSHLALSGLHGDTIQTCATTKGWIEAPLDYPSHLAEDPARYANEKNTALIPTEVMQGPGYDWHFRHAIILRQGRVYEAKMEALFNPGAKGKSAVANKSVVLLGDETASTHAADFGKEYRTFDMGFAGDRIENVMWRVQQGTLRGYAPNVVVLSVGKHNKGRNTPAEIAAARSKLLGMVRARVPRAEVRILTP